MLTRLIHRIFLTLVALTPEPTGSLSADQLETLLGFTARVLDCSFTAVRYRELFDWKAKQVRGYHALYTALVTALDSAARAHGRARFVELSPADQRAALAVQRTTRRAMADGDLVALARIAVLQRFWLKIDRHVAGEVLALFAGTDAREQTDLGPALGLPAGHEPPGARA